MQNAKCKMQNAKWGWGSVVLLLMMEGCRAPAVVAPSAGEEVGDEDAGEAPPSGTAGGKRVRCNRLFRALKTATDPGASGIEWAHPVSTTIAELGGVARPSSRREEERVAPVETTAYVLRDVRLSRYKVEEDGDYHLVLEDGAGGSLIAEAVDARCVPETALREKMIRVRQALEAKLPVSRKFVRRDEVISVAGPGFFDKPHRQRGAAPNFVEIHPILEVCFGRGCLGDASSPGSGPRASTE
jgi:hypothetical protein